ncbi:transcriptional regulator GcvA [Ferrovibrio terrae]|uniref:Transcriptional regulator GcvA n=1 Tax=Ferrovibrio terrae TaxID=2594003 RepID=A0A516H115_9PROT|nr:transcriptional regulator GcvA [Ferrovibrio terrae]QDO97462.1 transcriptional regulator GcvA [Ferrovibrio terrae]
MMSLSHIDPARIPGGLPSLNALRAFVAAGRHLSFTRAADELHVTQGAVSRLVKQLEEDLGVSLFSRGPRGLELTEAGGAYLPPLTEAFERMLAATKLIMRSTRPANRLAITMLPTFAMRWFMPRLADFHQLNPEIAVDVTSADRPVDFASEPVDVGIQYGSGNWSAELHAEFLFPETVTLVASPALLKSKALRKPDDVKRHVLLTHSTRPEAWAEWFASAGLKGSAGKGPAFEHFFMSIEAAVNGLGLALVPDFFVVQELRDGRLVEPLPEFRLRRPGGYYLLCLKGREREPAIRGFRNWLFS